MSTLFTAIINGELPGRFVWEDELVVGFLTIAPISPGHTLVVPRMEVDHWLDAPNDLLTHTIDVAHSIGEAIRESFQPVRVALLIAGFEIPHMHVHVLGAASEAELKFENANPNTPAAELDAAKDRIRAALRGLGHGDAVPSG
jgi:diadenosine tetraphosphate (Ap4A) HIT family hydrolase